MLIIALVLAFSGSDDEAAPSPSTSDAVAARDDASPDKPDANPADADDTKAPSEPEPEPELEPEPTAEDPKPAKPAEPEPEPEPAEPEPEAPALDLEGAQKSLGHRSTVDPALLEGAVLSPTAPEDRAAIAQALEEREVRSWNAFLIAGDDAPSMTFGDAETFCKTLSAGDISGWRLPSVGELLSITGAKLLDRKGVFWSETPGDAFGDTRLVVNAKKGSTSAVTVGWDGARPVCVRVRE